MDVGVDPDMVVSVLLITFTEECHLLRAHSHPINCLCHNDVEYFDFYPNLIKLGL